jgi:2-dehydropantoate 2-reductase
MERAGLLLETSQMRQAVPVAAATDAAAVRDADIVLLCVKTLDTEEAARAVAPHLTEKAAVVSMQNGVDNAERIHARTGIRAIAAVVYVGAEMAAPGHVRHTARGDLIVGDVARFGPGDAARRLLREKVSKLFVRAGVPCRVSETIEADLWKKLMINCAYNAISALGRARYGRIAASVHARDILRQIVEEAVAVARADGVQLADDNMVEAAWKLAESMPGTLSSTAQDIGRGKRTEIDSLNGYVARRGAALGIATPVNQTLHALVKLLEEPAEPL